MKISQINPRKIAIIFLFLNLLISIGLTSCITEKKRLEICNTCPVVTVSNDSTYEKVVHDTITLPPIVGPTIYIPNPCQELCDSFGRLKSFVKTERINGIKSTISTTGNVLVFKCEADSLIAYIDHMEKESWHRQHDQFTKFISCGLEHRTSFDGFCRWFFYILGGLLVVKYILKYFKISLPFP